MSHVKALVLLVLSLTYCDVNILFDSFLLCYTFLTKDIREINLYTNLLKIRQHYPQQGGVGGCVLCK